jgi:hypothetical protein
MSVFTIAEHIASCLEEDGLAYAIGGALALTIWTLPRETVDVDLSIFARNDELPRVFDSLERAGVMLDRIAAAKTQARIAMFTGRAGRTQIDVFCGEHPHFDDVRKRRRQVASPETGTLLWFISPDDLAIFKLLFARAKDVPDLEHLFAGAHLDLAYIRGWLEKIAAPGDRRFALLDDLERRFGQPP